MCDVPEHFDKQLHRVFYDKNPRDETETTVLIEALILMVFEHELNWYAPFLYEFGRKKVYGKQFVTLYVRAAIYGHPDAYQELCNLGIVCNSEHKEQQYIERLDRIL